jgi:hypothetical protein
MGHQAQPRLAVPLELPVEVDPVLLLLFPSGFSRASDALCLDRHPVDDLLLPFEQAPELGPNSPWGTWVDYMPASADRQRAQWM